VSYLNTKLEYEGREEDFYQRSGWGESDVDICFIGEKDIKKKVMDVYRSLKKARPEVGFADTIDLQFEFDTVLRYRSQS